MSVRKKCWGGGILQALIKPVAMVTSIGVLAILAILINQFLLQTNHPDLLELNQSRFPPKSITNTEIDSLSNSICEIHNNTYTSAQATMNCLKSKLARGGYLIIGDSHGNQVFEALNIAYPNKKFVFLYQPGCVPSQYFSYKVYGNGCFTTLDKIRTNFIIGNSDIKGIIFASRYTDDIGVQTFINDIKTKVYGDTPLVIFNGLFRTRGNVTDVAAREKKVQDYYQLGRNNEQVIKINKKLATLKGVTIFDQYAVFCQDNATCMLNDNERALVWDEFSHFTVLGVKKLALAIAENDPLNF